MWTMCICNEEIAVFWTAFEQPDKCSFFSSLCDFCLLTQYCQWFCIQSSEQIQILKVWLKGLLQKFSLDCLNMVSVLVVVGLSLFFWKEIIILKHDIGACWREASGILSRGSIVCMCSISLAFTDDFRIGGIVALLWVFLAKLYLS